MTRNPISSIKTRLKSFGSIIEKLQRKGISLSDPDAMEAKAQTLPGATGGMFFSRGRLHAGRRLAQAG